MCNINILANWKYSCDWPLLTKLPPPRSRHSGNALSFPSCLFLGLNAFLFTVLYVTFQLTLQCGATSTARHAKTSPVVEQRALLVCCTVLLIRLYLDNIGRKCKRAAMYMFTKVLALLWCGTQLLQIIASFFSLLSKFGFFFCSP